MKVKSIVIKLWLVISLLILIVMGIVNLIQTDFIEKIYYQQKSKDLLSISEKIIQLTATEQEKNILEMKLMTIAEILNGNVMTIDKNKVVQSCKGWGEDAVDLVMDINNPHHQPLTEDDMNRLFSGETVIKTGINGQIDVLAVAMPVHKDEINLSAVIVHAPLDPLAEEVDSFKKITLYTGVGGIIVTTILSLFLFRRISQPLLNMSKVALAMASGDFSRRIHVRSNDEISLLGHSFNTLSTELQEKIIQLERQDQTRREFVTVLSHELRTPLTIIQAFTEVLQDNLAIDEQEKQQYLKHIYEEVERLKVLVNEMLDLKKMEEGRHDFEMEYVDLKSIAESLYPNIRTWVEEKGLLLHFTYDKGIYPVYCNPDRIKQVFINLVDNAIRHTPTGGEIAVRVRPEAKVIRIDIKDTGEGIHEEALPYIWDKFYKADQSRTPSRGGTGLGLAIVKQIVDAHNGQIEVRSKVGEGTLFTVLLPYRS